ncbi:SRPBCC family protein [Thalassolituus sp. LLYu03]|uniref:SRPBCC family protein n=1 Tax=Thalassolituus sp. LLYu03 TaxID=3421656 RepID=UPI003D27DA66
MKITVQTLVKAPMERVWSAWNSPADIVQWNTASPDWHSPRSEVDLREGGTFTTRMEARDGSMGFDFGGTYTQVVEHERIEFEMGDQRRVLIEFSEVDDAVRIVESFDAENVYSAEQQQQGWQAILDNFTRYVEASL